MANCCPSVRSQGWSHAAHDKCLGTPLTDGRSAIRAAQEEHPALTTSQTAARVVRTYQRAPTPLPELSTIPVLQDWGFGLAAFAFWTLSNITELWRETEHTCLQTQEFVFPLYCSKPGDHLSTFHFEHMNYSAHNNKELTVPLIYAIYNTKCAIEGIFFKALYNTKCAIERIFFFLIRTLRI